MEILYCDAAVVVVLKPAGVPSEHDLTGDADMVTLLSAYFRGKNESDTVFPVHRLDRGTGGVMVYARKKAAAAALSRAITDGKTEKVYLAVPCGIPTDVSGEMQDILYHDKRQNRSFVVGRERKDAKPAALRYRTIRSEDAFSLVAVRLLTGRTHQIRVQFASRMMPLVGDGKYGSRVKAPTIALFAAYLAFPHPTTGKTLSFTALPPDDVFPWSCFGKENLPSGDVLRKIAEAL